MVSERIWFGLAVFLGTVLGPVLFTVWIRNHERYHPEPWPRVFRAFAWGATGAVVLALILEILLAPSQVLQPVGVPSALAAALIVAPLVEEATKGLGLRWIEDEHVELEDGLVYGAAAGLGFSATENVVYGISAWLEGGLAPLVATVAVRTFTSSLLHATASAALGYAIWSHRADRGGALVIGVFYVGAVLLHSVFNLFASSQLYLSFLAVLVIAIGGFAWVRGRVQKLDHAS